MVNLNSNLISFLSDTSQRYASVISCSVVMMAIGSIYAISTWNLDIKNYLGYTQGEISLVNSMATFGKYFGVIIGFFHDNISPHQSMGIAWIGMVVIYGFIYIMLVYFKHAMSCYLFGIALLLIGQLTDFAVLACLGHNNTIFGAQNRGTVAGVLLSSFACAGMFFAFVYGSFFKDSSVDFFLFLTIFLAITLCFGYVCLYHGPVENAHHPKPEEEKKKIKELAQTPVGNATEETYKALPEKKAEIVENITGLQLFMDLRFWLLFTLLFCVVGASMFVNNTVAFINATYGGKKGAKTLLICSFSIGNCIARILAGGLSDYFINKVPRAAFGAIASVITVFAQLLFMTLPAQGLVVPVILSGFACGIVFGIYACLCREYFGPVHFGKNYTFLACAIAIGFPLVISPIASATYTANIAPGSKTCMGKKCYRPVFIINIILGLISLAACIALCIVTIRRKVKQQQVQQA